MQFEVQVEDDGAFSLVAFLHLFLFFNAIPTSRSNFQGRGISNRRMTHPSRQHAAKNRGSCTFCESSEVNFAARILALPETDSRPDNPECCRDQLLGERPSPALTD